MNIADCLTRAAKELDDAGVPEARREASSLLEFATGQSRTFIIAHPEYDLSPAEIRTFDQAVKRRTGREPLQYITGRKNFFGLDFEVTPAVLIPRPETEMLVEASIEKLKEHDAPRFYEVGIGSGCISVSILHELRKAQASSCDISADAIDVARRNAELHGVSDRLDIKQADLFEAVGDQKFHLIVSNPPYVPHEDLSGLQPEVRDFEPLAALTDGRDGLSIIRRVIAGAPERLEPGGSLLIEIGFGQGDSVRSMFDPKLWRSVEIVPDVNAIPRMAAATLL